MTTDPFVYEALPMRVAFDLGLEPLRDLVRDLEMTRIVVICTPDRESLGRRVARIAGPDVVDVMAEAVMHVPSDVVDRCARRVQDLGCDGYVAVGGGSSIGLAKALALRTGAPIIAVPTTYAGSEMTPIWGITENQVKRTGRNSIVLPRAVVYDPVLTVDLPPAVSASSGMNAIAHAVEGLYAPDRSPVVSMMAREGARSLASALPRVLDDPGDLNARKDALYGAWLCGAVLGATTMSLHHKLCHVLGGTFNLPHAQTHAIVLPHVLAFNAPFAGDMVSALTGVFGPGTPWTALWRLQQSLPVPESLRVIGLEESDISEVVRQVLASPYQNPRPIGAAEIQTVIERAWAGTEPDTLAADRLAASSWTRS